MVLLTFVYLHCAFRYCLRTLVSAVFCALRVSYLLIRFLLPLPCVILFLIYVLLSRIRTLAWLGSMGSFRFFLLHFVCRMPIIK